MSSDAIPTPMHRHDSMAPAAPRIVPDPTDIEERVRGGIGWNDISGVAASGKLVHFDCLEW